VIQYRKDPSFTDFLTMVGVKATQEEAVKIDWGQGQFTSNLKPFVPYMVLEGY